MRKSYPSYKDTGIEWIGEIPSHWHISKIKYSADEDRNSFIDGDWIESPYIADKGIRYITTGNIGEGIYKEQGNGFISEKTFKELNCTEVFCGDLLISRLSTPVGRCCIIPDLGFRIITSVDNVIFRPNKSVERKYLLYLFNTQRYYEYTALISRGTTLTRISRTILGNINFPMPLLHEQKHINLFLDDKTKFIDDLIEKTKQKIELLKEKRTSLINHCVTKGLNPGVEMIDSGIEWIGKIPINWILTPIKHVVEKNKDAIRTGPFGSQLKSTDMIDKGIKIYNQRTVYDENFSNGEIYISPEKFKTMKSFTVYNGDILISSRGTIGKMAIVPIGAAIGVLHPCLIRLRIDFNRLLKKYLWWYINHSSLFLESVKYESNATTIDVIYSNILAEIKIPLPPISEQQKIVEFLDSQTQRIDTLIDKENKRIELLKEYRQSLISEVVTGKIDVREEVAV